jgi:hypothetical protein
MMNKIYGSYGYIWICKVIYQGDIYNIITMHLGRDLI